MIGGVHLPAADNVRRSRAVAICEWADLTQSWGVPEVETQRLKRMVRRFSSHFCIVVLLTTSSFRCPLKNPPPSLPTLRTLLNMLAPLPTIRSASLREQIFTHSSLNARPRNEFEAPQDDPLRDNERYVLLPHRSLVC